MGSSVHHWQGTTANDGVARYRNAAFGEGCPIYQPGLRRQQIKINAKSFSFRYLLAALRITGLAFALVAHHHADVSTGGYLEKNKKNRYYPTGLVWTPTYWRRKMTFQRWFLSYHGLIGRLRFLGGLAVLSFLDLLVTVVFAYGSIILGKRLPLTGCRSLKL